MWAMAACRVVVFAASRGSHHQYDAVWLGDHFGKGFKCPDRSCPSGPGPWVFPAGSNRKHHIFIVFRRWGWLPHAVSMSSGANFLNLILPSCGFRRSEMSRSLMILRRGHNGSLKGIGNGFGIPGTPRRSGSGFTVLFLPGRGST